MRRTRTAAIAALMSVIALLTMAGPASAQVIVAAHGKTGDWGYLPADDMSSPGGKCGYSDRHADNWAYLRWIKARGPVIGARDTTAGRDHQTVSWQVQIQRQASGGAWQTMKSSAVHSATAYDDTGAHFSAIKVKVNGTNDQLWRALVILQWHRNGAVEGWIKERPSYYGVKWTVGSPDFVFSDACGGRAD